MEIQKELGQMSAEKLADYILMNFGPMSHLKLQKLLFYCEGYHLGYFGEPLVYENFQAWVHGPVCVEVYQTLKGHSVLYSDIAFVKENAAYNPNEYIQKSLSSKQIELVNDVLSTLSNWKDSELEAATHREKPWIEARQGLPDHQKHNGIISKVTMMNYYREELANGNK